MEGHARIHPEDHVSGEHTAAVKPVKHFVRREFPRGTRAYLLSD
jgi:hypothetical protein